MHACMQYHVSSLKHPKTFLKPIEIPHRMFHWSMTWRDPTYPLQGASENWMPRFCKVFTKLPRTSVTWLEIVEMCLEMLSLQPGSHCNHHHARSHIAFPLKHDHCFSYLLSSTCCTAGSAGDWRVVDESGHHKLLDRVVQSPRGEDHRLSNQFEV